MNRQPESSHVHDGADACAACGCQGETVEASRRGFFRSAIAGTAIGLLAGAAVGLGGATKAQAQSQMSPDEALQALMDGNQRYMSGQLKSFSEDLDMLKQHTAEKQEPFAAVLSCADSRVPVELVFDQSIGQIFVTRVAGNVITPEITASLEYGVAVLGTKVILVLGHGNCGAAKAAIQGKEVPGQISALYAHIRPAVDEVGADLDAVIDANARIQASLLRQSSPVMAQAIKEGKLRVLAGRYDLASGKVSLIG